jgi:hypothetical protein
MSCAWCVHTLHPRKLREHVCVFDDEDTSCASTPPPCRKEQDRGDSFIACYDKAHAALPIPAGVACSLRLPAQVTLQHTKGQTEQRHCLL